MTPSLKVMGRPPHHPHRAGRQEKCLFRRARLLCCAHACWCDQCRAGDQSRASQPGRVVFCAGRMGTWANRSMTPFSATPAHSEVSLGQRLAGRTPVVVLVTALVLGLAAVGWRASVRLSEAQIQARTQAAAYAMAVERELVQAVTATEALGAMAGQAGANTVTFEKLAGQLQLSRPGVSSMEWQPGGITANVVPHNGNLGLGQNLLKEGPHREAAYAAIRRRSLIVTGPVPLARGDLGFVARLPVFVKGRDGRESFWGFVSASVRGRDLLERSQLSQLWERGYEYRLFIPRSGSRKAVVVAGQGASEMNSAVQQRLRASNLEMVLAVQPRSGWLGLSLIGLQSLATLLGAGLLALLAALWEERQDHRNTRGELSRKLNRESSDKTQALDQCRVANEEAAGLRSELAAVKTTLQTTEAALGELQNQFETTLQALSGAEENSRKTQMEAGQQMQDLQARVKEQARVAGELLNTGHAELRQGKAELEMARKEITELKTRLEEADLQARQIAEETARVHKLDQVAISEWQSKYVSREQFHATETQKQTAQVNLEKQRVKNLEAELEELLAAIEGLKNQSTPILPSEPPSGKDISPFAPAPALASDGEPVPTSNGEAALENEGHEDSTVESSVPAPTNCQNPEPSENTSELAPEKSVRKRKSKRDHQIDLFELGVAAPAPEPILETSLENATAAATLEDSAVAQDHSAIQPTPLDSGLPVESVETAHSEPDVSEDFEFPAVPGLAVTEGLALADGSARKYKQNLENFAEHHRKAAEKIRDAMVQGDIPAAERVLNGLKVAAGEIGAVVLRAAAGNLDQAMHGESDPAEVEFMWLEMEKTLKELLTGLQPLLEEPKETSTRALRPAPPKPKLDPSQLRKAVNQILPLLTDQDPGAKDCFRDNRSVFRPVFAPEAFTEFEQAVKRNDFAHGLDLLKKAAKRHGI